MKYYYIQHMDPPRCIVADTRAKKCTRHIFGEKPDNSGFPPMFYDAWLEDGMSCKRITRAQFRRFKKTGSIN